MIRVCMDCRRLLGEKCPVCGGCDIRVPLVGGAIRYCTGPRGCWGYFESANEETSGLCNECLEKRRAQIPAPIEGARTLYLGKFPALLNFARRIGL